MKKMKVCMPTTSFPRYKGDLSGNFVYELAKNLVKRGVEVSVVAPHDYDTKGYEVMDGIEVYRFQYMFPKKLQEIAYSGGIPSNLRRSLIAKLELPLFMLSFFLKSLGVCRRCDIIHAHWTFSGLIGVFLKKVHGKPLALTVHGSDINNLPPHGLMKKTSVYVLKNADKIVAVSNALKDTVTGFGILSDKVKVIPNAVELSDFPPGLKERMGFKILFVGRLVPEKGLEYLIKSMEFIVKEIPQATLTVVGGGPMREELEGLVEGYSMGDKIRFEGMKPHSEILRYLQDTDLFVLSSLSEGLPLTVLEAMAAGKPVVATNVGGIPDAVIDGESGILVPPKDIDALSKAIISLLGDRVKQIRMGEKARKRSEEKFSWEKIVESVVKIYNLE